MSSAPWRRRRAEGYHRPRTMSGPPTNPVPVKSAARENGQHAGRLRLRPRVRPCHARRRGAARGAAARAGAADRRRDVGPGSALPPRGARAVRGPPRSLRRRPRPERRAGHRRSGHRRRVAAVPGRVRRRVAREARWLRERGRASCSATSRRSPSTPRRRPASPSSRLANFSWDWIYRHLAARQPALARSRRPGGGVLRALRPAARAAVRRRPVGLPAPRAASRWSRAGRASPATRRAND